MNKLPIIAIALVVAAGAWWLGGGMPETVEAPETPAAGSALAEVALPASLSEQAQIGQRIYEAKCAACHNENAAGQEGVAPPLVHRIYEPSHHADEAFQRAVGNALEKSALSLEVAAQTFARSEVEAVLEVFAGRFARDIKPMVSRPLRQLRDLRARSDLPGISEVEDSCMATWETLVELERYSGPRMMADTIASTIKPLPAAVVRRKPPSPFARITH